MALFLDKDGLEAPLKHVAGLAVLSIDPLSVDPVDLAHALRQIRVGCLDEQVDSVATLRVARGELRSPVRPNKQ